MTGRGGNKIKTRLGFLLYGDYGTWKSSFCLESIKLKNENGKPFRVMFIDPESGGIDTYLDKYEEEGYDLRNIYVVYTQSLSEVEELIRRAKNNEDFYEFDDDGNELDEVYLDADGEPFRPDMIVVDGATVLYTAKQQSIIEFSKKRAIVRAKKNELTGMEKEVAIEGAGMEIKDFNTLKFDGQNLILDLLASGKHFAVTAREKDETDSYKDSKTGEIKSMRTGRKIPDGFKDVGYNCKTVIRMFKDTDGIIKGLIDNKDRTLVHQQNEVIIEPSILDWQAAITKNKGKKDFIVQNNMNAAIEKELKEIEKENAKFDSEYDEKSSNMDADGALKTVEDYQNAIKAAITALPATEKSKKQTEITAEGLPKAYQKLTDIEQLKKYYSIVAH